MKLGIIIPTYRKPDGSTYNHVKNTLLSVKKQTHQDYKVFLIGDKYEDDEEFKELSKIIDSDKIVSVNLDIAVERGVYKGLDLWVCGGVNAHNHGVELAISEGYNYICHLDHDDWYLENHLENISNAIDLTGTHFLSTYCGEWPVENGFKGDSSINDKLSKFIPLRNKIFKVTTCVDYLYYNFRMRNMVKEFGKVYASDADLWDRIGSDMIQKNEYGVLINENTCGRAPGKSVLKYY